jgi:ribosomal protein S18 acetylase RimI-like enzyme
MTDDGAVIASPSVQADVAVTVRRAMEADVAAIVELWHDLQEANRGYDKRLAVKPSAREWYESFIRLQLEHENAMIAVAVLDGKVVGYGFGQIMQRPTLADGDCGYIADLSVASPARGRGIGRRLFLEIRSWFYANGVRHIEVQVVRNNPASQAFWRKMGFGEFLRTLRSDL